MAQTLVLLLWHNIEFLLCHRIEWTVGPIIIALNCIIIDIAPLQALDPTPNTILSHSVTGSDSHRYHHYYLPSATCDLCTILCIIAMNYIIIDIAPLQSFDPKPNTILSHSVTGRDTHRHHHYHLPSATRDLCTILYALITILYGLIAFFIASAAIITAGLHLCYSHFVVTSQRCFSTPLIGTMTSLLIICLVYYGTTRDLCAILRVLNAVSYDTLYHPLNSLFFVGTHLIYLSSFYLLWVVLILKPSLGSQWLLAVTPHYTVYKIQYYTYYTFTLFYFILSLFLMSIPLYNFHYSVRSLRFVVSNFYYVLYVFLSFKMLFCFDCFLWLVISNVYYGLSLFLPFKRLFWSIARLSDVLYKRRIECYKRRIELYKRRIELYKRRIELYKRRIEL
eukprot:785350_1